MKCLLHTSFVIFLFFCSSTLHAYTDAELDRLLDERISFIIKNPNKAFLDINSIESILPTMKNKVIITKIHFLLAQYYFTIKEDLATSTIYINKFLKSDYQPQLLLIDTNYIQGMIADYQGEIKNAIAYFSICIQLSEKIDNIERKSLATARRAIALASLGNFKDALVDAANAYDAYSKIDNPIIISETLSSIAAVYMYMEDLDQQLKYNLEAVKWMELSDYVKGKSYVYYNLAIVHELRKEFDLAREALTKSMNYAKAINDEIGVAFAHTGIAYIDAEQKNYDEALPLLIKYLPIFDELKSVSNQVITRIWMAESMTYLGKLDEALKVLNEAEAIAIAHEEPSFEWIADL